MQRRSFSFLRTNELRHSFSNETEKMTRCWLAPQRCRLFHSRGTNYVLRNLADEEEPSLRGETENAIRNNP